MHPAYFTAFASIDAEAPGFGQPVGVQPEFAEVLGDTPPHAANPIPRATTATATISVAGHHRRRPLVDVRGDSRCVCCTPTSIHR
jgi:hypothetical protein